jgi:peptidoglycan/xylan/chitin deacetylase (PgdA/CDA1 family)
MFTLVSPVILQKLFPALTWKIPGHGKKIYLTFDDGPMPGVTEWVLQQLDKYHAKATFFCLGKNIVQNPGLFKEINQRGHQVGNHTFNHLKGWRTKNQDYYNDIQQASQYVKSDYFRPPYGQITIPQIQTIRKQYNIIMWDVLTKDYDRRLTGEECFRNVTRFTRHGSIIVFHDSFKAQQNLQYTLPKTLDLYSEKGFEFASLGN